MKAKNSVNFWILIALLSAVFSNTAFAQDDLYYDPDRNERSRPYQRQEERYVTPRYEDDEAYGYDDEYYDYEDDYAYEYSSRIRRFHRPATIVDYYDPFFVDLYFYDPFFLPGASIYTWGYNDFWAWRRWNRWNRFNNFGWGGGWNNPYAGWGWNAWNFGPGWGGGWGPGWGGGWGWNAWNNVYVFNNFYYDPYWTWNGCNPYYGNTWVNNNYFFNNNPGNNNGFTPRTYTGVRRGGTTVKTDGYARINDNGRIVDKGDKNVPTIELQPRNNGRVIDSDREPMRAEDRNGLTPRPDYPSREGRNPADARRDDVPARDARDVPATRPSREPEVRPRPESPTTRPSREVKPNGDEPVRQSESRPNREVRPGGDTPSRPPRTETTPSRRQGGTPDRSSYDRPGSNDRPSRSTYDRPSSEERSSRPSYDRPSSSDRPSRSGGNSGGYSPSRNSSPSGGGGSRDGSGGGGSKSAPSGSGRSGRN